jgi:hypothetical protein
MTIATYADLQAAAAAWLIRSDLTARIPDFISLAESRLNRMLRERRAEMDVPLVAVPGSRLIALPGAYSEALTAWITPPGTFDRMQLRFVDPAALDVSLIQGQPYGWTIDGSNLGFERPCDQAYAITLRCIEKYALSATVTTNSLLTDYPDAYLFATLCEAGPFLRNPDVTTVYEQKLTRAIEEINEKDFRSRAQQTLVTEVSRRALGGRRSGYNPYTDGSL